ncbi:MAG: hypothetical protein V4687_16475 [Bacteroidota bacterium]
MKSEDLKKLDVIPTSRRPWYTRTPFLGIIAFIAFLLIKALLSWIG